ncbi:MAG: BMP family ABC transporter substrate-binding protein, partial [Anaerolineales bacterium]|nr:BMP family ABC transporter substrate-binding protein [Anaerolineales bacterium]
MRAKSFHILVAPWGLAGLLVLLLFIALAAPPAAAQQENGWSIGLVPDAAGVDDGGFNQLAYAGVLRAVSELGVTANVYTPTDMDDIENQLQNCADAGNDLCLGVGFWASDPILTVANANPGTKFALVDGAPESPPANLRGMVFAEREAGYLAGTLAGLMTTSDRVGVIGGMQVVPAVVEFVEGY